MSYSMTLGNWASNFESGLLKHIFIIVVFSFSNEIAFGYDLRCQMAFLYKIYFYNYRFLLLEAFLNKLQGLNDTDSLG